MAKLDDQAGVVASFELPLAARVEKLRTIKTSVAHVAERLSRAARIRFATKFAMTTLEIYWRDIQREYAEIQPIRPLFEALTLPELEDTATWLSARLAQAAAAVDPVTAGYFIGTAYAAALPTELRSRLGVYYTPPAIAARLLEQATAAGADWASCSVLDPACGGGAFLAPVAERIIKELSHVESGEILDGLAKRVRGFEIDPVAAWMSQVLFDALVLPLCHAAGRQSPIVVEVRDTLVHDLVRSNFDLVMGNPPYGRITLSPRMRRRYETSLYGHANLYGLFTDVALRWVKPGGIVAYVTPTSFLAGQYFKNLRGLLGRQAPPVTIDFIAERKGVFDEVLQETVLATYRRLPEGASKRGGEGASVTFVTPVDETVVRINYVGSFGLPRDPSTPWLVPRDMSQDALIKRLVSMPDRLVDWGYSVSTGPLVWNRHKNQLRQDHGPGCLPLVWAEAVRPDGTFCLRASKINHRQFFRPRSTDRWLVITAPCVLVQRTTAKEQSRRLIATVLPIRLLHDYGGAVVENHLNMVRPTNASPAVTPRTLAAFLNSSMADRIFRCLSGSVAVSAYELEALPLPPPSRIGEFDAAVRRRAPRDELDRICERLYGPDRGA